MTRYYRLRSVNIVRQVARRARKKPSRLLMVFLLAASLVACVSTPTPESLVVPDIRPSLADQAENQTIALDLEPTPEIFTHVQCFIENELVFDQHFDRAVLNADNTITVWLGDESVIITQAGCRATR